MYRKVLGIHRGPIYYAAVALMGLAPIIAWIWAIPAVGVLLVLTVAGARRHGRIFRPYQAAQARFEGGGIKRGLTPPEAAALLGRPMGVILGVAVVELLHKGLLQMDGDILRPSPPMRTERLSQNPEKRHDLRRLGAQTLNATLHPFEVHLLELVEQSNDRPLLQYGWGLVVRPLMRHVAERVGGYDLDSSREYYRLLIRRAPVEARTEGNLTTEREKVIRRNLGWLLLADEYESLLDGYCPDWFNGARTRTLAGWFSGLTMGIGATLSETDLQVRLGDAVDELSASLMADIAQATYYG